MYKGNILCFEILGLIIFFADDIKWYIEQKEHYKHWEHVCNVIIKLILLETKSPTSIFGKIIPRALMATKHSWSNHTLPIYILYIHCLHLRNHSFIFHVVFCKDINFGHIRYNTHNINFTRYKFLYYIN